MQWFQDPRVRTQLPLPLRCYCAYCSRRLDPATGKIRGGSFLLRLLRRCANGTDGAIPVAVDGLTIVVEPYSETAAFALNELSEPGDEARILRLALSPGDTFFDVGANHGAFSLIAAALVGPSGSVVAFEPQPDLADLLASSFAINGFSHASVQPVALSDHEGEATLFIPDHAARAGVYEAFSATGRHQAVHVPLITLDQLIDHLPTPGKLFIKLDAEGSELAFLRGAAQTLRTRRPEILLELNPESAAAAGYRVADLIAQLQAIGYRHFAEMEHYPHSLPLHHLTPDRMNSFRDIVVLP